MPKDNKYVFLLKNTFFFAFGSFGSKLISFFLVPLYTTVLSTSDYGTADMILTTKTVAFSICTLCIADAVMLFAVQQKDKRNQVFSFGLQIILSSILFIGIIDFVLWKLKVIHWPDYCYLFLFIEYSLFVLSNLLTNFVTALEKIISVAISGAVTTLITVLSSVILLIVFNFGLKGYLTATCLGQLFSCIFLLLVIITNKGSFTLASNKRIFEVDSHLKKEMLAYSIPLIFNAVSWWINGSLDRYIIVAYLGISQSGIYSVASKIPTIISVIQSIFGQAWSLSSVKEYDSDNKSEFFGNIYAIYSALMIISCSFLIFANNFLAKILFSKDFFVAKEFSSILIISSAISGMGSVLSTTFSITKKTNILAYTSIITALVNITLNLVLIPRIGNYGAAIATTIAFFCMWIIRYFKAKKLIPFEYCLLKDITSFIILGIQVIIAHYCDKIPILYIGQLVLIVIILIMYRKKTFEIVNKIIYFIKLKLS